MKLIDKDALVAEIERRLNHQVYLSVEREIRKQLLNGLLSFIDTLEVKEVDLEKEIDTNCTDDIYDYLNGINCGGSSWVDRDLQESYEFIKAQKGEEV